MYLAPGCAFSVVAHLLAGNYARLFEVARILQEHDFSGLPSLRSAGHPSEWAEPGQFSDMEVSFLLSLCSPSKRPR